jgi:hypothetical protein
MNIRELDIFLKDINCTVPQLDRMWKALYTRLPVVKNLIDNNKDWADLSTQLIRQIPIYYKKYCEKEDIFDDTDLKQNVIEDIRNYFNIIKDSKNIDQIVDFTKQYDSVHEYSIKIIDIKDNRHIEYFIAEDGNENTYGFKYDFINKNIWSITDYKSLEESDKRIILYQIYKFHIMEEIWERIMFANFDEIQEIIDEYTSKINKNIKIVFNKGKTELHHVRKDYTYYFDIYKYIKNKKNGVTSLDSNYLIEYEIQSEDMLNNIKNRYFLKLWTIEDINIIPEGIYITDESIYGKVIEIHRLEDGYIMAGWENYEDWYTNRNNYEGPNEAWGIDIFTEFPKLFGPIILKKENN